MGRKVHPIGFRLGGVRDWESRWYADRNYSDQLHEDLRVRRFVRNRLANAAVSRVTIARSGDEITVNVFTAKPGIVIGKGGSTVDALRRDLEARTGKRINLNIEEIRQPELDAQLVAESIGEQINKRVSYKRAQKQAVQRAIRAGARGVRIRVSGLLAGPSSMSRSVTEKDGRVPLQTLRSDIDYGQVHVHTPGGRIGVKVWIYKGDILPAGEIDVRPVVAPPPVPERDRPRRGPRDNRGGPPRGDRGPQGDRAPARGRR